MRENHHRPTNRDSEMVTEETYPESKSCLGAVAGGVKLIIVKHDTIDHYCGYAVFPSRPSREEGYNGLLTYVPVHGGITYATQREDGTMAYGFDCGHAGDDTNPDLRSLPWLLAECGRMALSITEATIDRRSWWLRIWQRLRYGRAEWSIEDRYLATEDSEERAGIIDEYHKVLREKHGIGFELQDNFGAMIGCLAGRL